MKKRIIRIVIPIILMIAIIIAIIIVKNNKKTEIHLLSEVYNQLNGITSYQFQKEKDMNNKTIVVKDGNNAVIDNYTSGTHTTTVIKDNATTYITHEKE